MDLWPNRRKTKSNSFQNKNRKRNEKPNMNYNWVVMGVLVIEHTWIILNSICSRISKWMKRPWINNILSIQIQTWDRKICHLTMKNYPLNFCAHFSEHAFSVCSILKITFFYCKYFHFHFIKFFSIIPSISDSFNAIYRILFILMWNFIKSSVLHMFFRIRE